MDNVNKKNELARQLWLACFNRTLRDKEPITEQEYRKIHVMIYRASARSY